MSEPESTLPRHARRTLLQRGWPAVAAVATAGLVVVAAVAAGASSHSSGVPAEPPAADFPVATSLPVPAQRTAAIASCEDAGVASALAGGTDAEVIAALGGAEQFRALVAGGSAPCISLSDPSRTWVVVDKTRPLDPLDFAPASLVAPDAMQRTADVRLRPEAAAALTALAAAAAAEGAGAIGLNSAYRSYDSQARTYSGYVGSLGRAQADLQSARPGYSEHQTGLAADVAACDSGCAGIESFGGTPQADWVAANAWRFGFVVRYEDGRTAITGYEWEPWHLRYIGPELAAAYHDGGFHTLEEFFGLSAAPDYAG